MIITPQNANANDPLTLALANLRQRRASIQVGNPLVGSINCPTPVSRYKRKPTLDIAALPLSLKTPASLLVDPALPPAQNISKIMIYQKKCWEQILNDTEPLIITAPTGFGKTEAFMPPIVDRILSKDALAIFIYPRNSLTRDQLGRVLKLGARSKAVYGKPLKVGMQLGGIGASTENTLLYNHVMRGEDINDRTKRVNEITVKRRGNIPMLDPSLTSSNDAATLEYIDFTRDRVTLEIEGMDKCPVCQKGALQSTVWYKLSGRIQEGFMPRHKVIERVDPFVCSNSSCRAEFDISLSREDHVKKKVNILLTTVESLEMLLMSPVYADWLRSNLDVMVFDEVHSYRSIYGAHVANIVRRIKNMRPGVKLVGVSATIDSPQTFGSKFFDEENVTVIQPEATDKELSGFSEHFYFIRTAADQEPASVYVQTAMFLGHSIIPPGKRMYFFFDSTEMVHRSTQQLIDAETNPGLWRFRATPGPITYPKMTCNGPTGDCFNNGRCPIYDIGECWYGVSKAMGIPNMPFQTPMGRDLVQGTSSKNRSLSDGTRIVNTTSVLELGIDDPNVMVVGQYRAPHAVYDFIQRKGRAGRRQDEDVRIFAILGNEVSDLFYFKRADRIVTQRYNLPLKPENPGVVYLHDLLQYISDETVECARKRFKEDPENPKLNSYDRECTWTVMLNRIVCPRFRDFLLSSIGLSGSSVTAAVEKISNRDNNLLRDEVKKAIERKNKEIQEISEKYNGAPLPLSAVTQKMQEIAPLLSKYPSANKIFKDAQNDLVELNKIINNNEEDAALAAGAELMKKLYQIPPALLLQPSALKDPAYMKVSELIQAADKYIITGGSNIFLDTQAIEKLRHEIESLLPIGGGKKKWEDALSMDGPSFIVKHILRSWYFYCKACADENKICEVAGEIEDGKIRYPMKICPPQAYFEEPGNLILQEGQRTYRINDIDILSKHIPYRANLAESGAGVRWTTVKFTVDPTSVRPSNTVDAEFNISPYYQGRGHVEGDKFYVTPEIVYAQKIELDPDKESIVKMCPKCKNYYSISEQDCPIDKTQLKPARFKSTPIIGTSFAVTGGEIQVSPFLKIANIRGDQKLTGVEVDVRYYKSNPRGGKMPIPDGPLETYIGHLETPIYLRLDTRGIVFTMTDNLMRSILTDELVGYLRHKNGSPEEVMYHTIAHILIQLVASVAGINPDLLYYDWDEGRKEIAVWERYEGGSGISETFRDVFQSNPKAIYNELKSIVECPANRAELELRKQSAGAFTNVFKGKGNIEEMEMGTLLDQDPGLRKGVLEEVDRWIAAGTKIDSYHSKTTQDNLANALGRSRNEIIDALPSCIDGCSFCIGVPYCKEGKDTQFTTISLRVAKRFLDCVLVKSNDKDEGAKIEVDGGSLVRVDGQTNTYLCL